MKIYAVSYLGNSWHVHLYDDTSDHITVIRTDMSEDNAVGFALLKAEQDQPSQVKEIFPNGEFRLIAQFGTEDSVIPSHV